MAQTDKFRKYKSLFSTTLNNSIGTGTGETITLNSAAGLPTDTEITITIDRVDANGNATPSKMERITGTISGSNLTSYTRGVDGTTEQAHSAGAVVEMVWNAADWNDALDGILDEHDQDGTHSDIHADSIELGGAGVTADSIKDEDDMASDSATALATQQSIKKYVDSNGFPTDGWFDTRLNGVTVTRDSIDDPTVVLTFDADVTDYIWKGSRIKLDEGGTTHYMIVSADPVYSDPNTTVTCLMEIDTSTPTQAADPVSTGTISNVAYAPPKTYPKGFPVDRNSWRIRLVDSNNYVASGTTKDAVYNPGNLSLTVAIGLWELSFDAQMIHVNTSANNAYPRIGLSTANNTLTSNEFTTMLHSDNSLINHPFIVKKVGNVAITSKTTYYLNVRSTTSGTISSINVNGANCFTIIEATSTLL